MRQGKNNRGRGRARRNGGGGVINRNTTLDSNGPDVRLRGNAFQLYEKYVSLGNDASAAGERISAEAYYQHADHYFRVNSAIIAASEERRTNHQGGQPQGGQQAQPAQSGNDKEQGNGNNNNADGDNNGNADNNADKAAAASITPAGTPAGQKPEAGDKGDAPTPDAG